MSNQLPDPKITIPFDNGQVKIHTFISADAFLANATHIVETQNEIVIIDGQFIVPYAMQFRDYANKLNKPINRVFLSHNHPDHFFGLGAAFSDCKIYSLPETIDFLKAYGENIRSQSAAAYGDFVTKELAIPQFEVSEGKEIIDGLEYEFVIHKNTETDYQLSIKLESIKIFIIQDLVYSGAHVYITRDTENWINILNGLINSDFDLFLAGHGMPADKSELENVVTYLTKAQELLAQNVNQEEFKQELLSTFPYRTGEAVFDIYLPRLFGNNQ
jgi:glyoxylase-like metal-dependent hydrolase (beta-lactamase superfamily II)